jgi:predicted metal-dependent phosphotriesterase family hydrolase
MKTGFHRAAPRHIANSHAFKNTAHGRFVWTHAQGDSINTHLINARRVGTAVNFMGYSTIFTHLKPAVLQEGVTESDWLQVVKENPKQGYTIRIRKL